jgi:hypothetical protein
MSEYDIKDVTDWVMGDEWSGELSNLLVVDEEAQVAISAVRNMRAQIVVDTIAQEMYDRRADLLDRKSDLTEQLTEVGTNLAIIDSLEGKVVDNESINYPVNRMEQLGIYQDRKTFLSKVAEMPGFVIDIPADEWTSSEGREQRYGLNHWYYNRTRAIARLYGSGSSNSFSRLVTAISRRWRFDGDFQHMVGVGLVTNAEPIIVDDRPSSYRLTVDKPEELVGEILSSKYVGPKTAAAIFCIADMQAQERAGVDLTNNP